MKPILNALLVAAVVTVSGSVMAQDTMTTTPQSGVTASPSTGSGIIGDTLDSARIETLERTLSNRGYSVGMADGIMDSQTEAALREFQEDNGLTVTGTANSETMTELGMNTGVGVMGNDTPGTTMTPDTDPGSMDMDFGTGTDSTGTGSTGTSTTP